MVSHSSRVMRCIAGIIAANSTGGNESLHAGRVVREGGWIGMLRRAVFLDRDGVLNRPLVRNGKPYAPRRLADFRIPPDVRASLDALKEAGFFLSVVTNQPDVATGRQGPETVAAMHAVLRRDLPVDDVRACFHVDGDNCACRKPKPGMLVASAAANGPGFRRRIGC